MDPIVILFFLLFFFVLVFLYSMIRPILNYNFYYMNDNGFLVVEKSIRSST